MQKNFLNELFEQYLESGADPYVWWDEEHTPLDSIDKPVTDLMSLKGKKAIVTGGAGVNLGQACVNRLAGLGADVAVVDLKPDRSKGPSRSTNPPDAEGMANKVAERWGVKTVAVHGDVTDFDDLTRVVEECKDRLGGLDIMVNNVAGTTIKPFAELSQKEIDRSVSRTLLSTVYGTRIALDHMIPQGRGVIINIGSEAGGTHVPMLTIYGALKAGVQQLTRFVGKEVAKHGVRVVGVNPGSMWGPNRPLDPDSEFSLYPLARAGIGRYELPEEVANMVAFLASDAASAMVGSMIDMGGGLAI